MGETKGGGKHTQMQVYWQRGSKQVGSCPPLLELPVYPRTQQLGRSGGNMAGRETGMLEGGERSGRGEAGLPCCGSLPASHPAAAWGGAPSFPEPCWPPTFGVSLQLVSSAGVLEGRLQLLETGDLVLLLCPRPQRIPGARCPQSKGVGPACGVWSRLPRWSTVVGTPAWLRRPYCPGVAADHSGHSHVARPREVPAALY